MLKKIALSVVGVIVAAVAVVMVLASMKPDTFKVERSIAIKASPEKIYPLIEDYRRFSTWSPYEKLDPAMKRTYSGPERGRGAAYAWEGNSDVGSGRMEITDTAAPSKVTMALDFTRPFEAHNTVVFSLAPLGDSTQVTWAMQGPCPFISKVFQVLVDMDKMIGKDFEAGLLNLKRIGEQA